MRAERVRGGNLRTDGALWGCSPTSRGGASRDRAGAAAAQRRTIARFLPNLRAVWAPEEPLRAWPVAGGYGAGVCRLREGMGLRIGRVPV